MEPKHNHTVLQLDSYQEVLKSDGYEVRKVHLPDLTYFASVLKRNIFVSALATIPIAVIVIFGIASFKNEYTSQVIAVYDDSDMAEINAADRGVKFAKLESSFLYHLADPRFLEEAMLELGLFSGKTPVPAEEIQITGAPDKDRQRQIAKFRESLSSWVDEKNYSFFLAARAQNPAKAQEVAAGVIEIFIRKELSAEIARISGSLDVFATYFSEEREKIEKGVKTSTTNVLSAKSEGGGPQAPRQAIARHQLADLATKERSLLAEIDVKQRLVTDVASDRERQKLALEAELRKLKTTLRPSHPDILKKEEELQTLRSGYGQTSKEARELADMKRQLRGLQQALNVTGAAAEIDNYTDLTQSFLTGVAGRIHAWQLEKKNLETQLKNPTLRTRLRVAEQASLPTEPSNKDGKFKFMLFGALAIMATFFVTTIIRELISPYARDRWRVLNRTNLPLLGEITREHLKSKRAMTPAEIRKAQQRLGVGDEDSQRRTQRLTKYREIGFNLKSKCKGNRILLVQAGKSPNTAAFTADLLNVYSASTSQSAILIDFSAEEPSVEVERRLNGLANYLTAEASWQTVVVSDPEKYSFTLVPPIGIKDQMAVPFKFDSVHKLMQKLDNEYHVTFINAYKTVFFVENAALLDLASDCIIVVNAEKTKNAELDLLLQRLNPEKVRGLIILDT